MEYKLLFSPKNIGKVTINNRVVLVPAMLGLGQLDGRATERQMNYYEERAKGGVGLIITEITRINDNTGAAAMNQLGASHDYHIEPMRELFERVHKHGTKIFVQLHHPGRQNVGLMVHTLPISIKLDKLFPFYRKIFFGLVPFARKHLLEKDRVPASVCPSKVEKSNLSGGRVRALRKGEIKKLIQQFIDGAERVQKAGGDGVEVHASHGYLIQQFLSPHTNKRTDEYGGTLENRMRFLLEIISGIRQRCGKDFPIIVRLTVDECYAKIGRNGVGYTLDEGIEMAKILEKAGVDALDVSSGCYDTINYWLEPISFECGWRDYMAAEVKKAVKIPVIAANLIRSGEQAEQQLQDGKQDFVGSARNLIADPEWANKLQDGRENEIRRCICCLYCMESMMENSYHDSFANCAVNPKLGHEKFEIKQDGNNRKIIVVGAGISGLYAAEILAKRGFETIVYEKEKTVGGQLQYANKPPLKDKINWCIDDAFYHATKAGAIIKLGITANLESIKQENPYAVIIATGATSIKPKSIKGVDLPNVCTVTDYLGGAGIIENGKVVVIGSGMTGLETAEKLLEDGNKVTVIEMADEIAPGAWLQNKQDILPRLKKVKMLSSTKLVEINEKGVLVEDVKKKTQYSLDCDYVVLSLGVKPENELYKALQNDIQNLFVIGDAKAAGRIANATKSAYELAINIK